MELSTAVGEFVAFCAAERKLSPCTVEAYEADLRDFCRFVSLNCAGGAITTEVVVRYAKCLLSERALAQATVRRRLACLRVFFRRLANKRTCEDPFAAWELKFPRQRRLPRALSGSEVCSLVKSSPKGASRFAGASDLSVAICIMVSTGIRVGELCKLRAEDVSPDGSSLRIQGKGLRDRFVYVTDPYLRDELKRLLGRTRESAFRALFRNRRGTPLRPPSVRSYLHQCARNVDLQRRVTPHMLRHTAATLLVEQGVDIRFIQRLLGHSSIATTEIYTHVADIALRERLEKADILGVVLGAPASLILS